MPQPVQVDPEHFTAALRLGDRLALLGKQGFKQENGKSGIYEVRGVEHIPLLGVHGAVPLWAQQAFSVSNLPPYVLDPQAVNQVGNIQANGGHSTVTPFAFQFSKHQLAQFRWGTKDIGDPPPGLSIEDFDWQVAQPSANVRWQPSSTPPIGVYNQMMQAAFPSDTALMPPQGGIVAPPQAFSIRDFFDAAWHTELWTYEDAGPTFTMTNNGSVPTSGTPTNYALAVVASLYVYWIPPLGEGGAPVQKSFVGASLNVPSSVDWDTLKVVTLNPRYG